MILPEKVIDPITFESKGEFPKGVKDCLALELELRHARKSGGKVTELETELCYAENRLSHLERVMVNMALTTWTFYKPTYPVKVTLANGKSVSIHDLFQ